METRIKICGITSPDDARAAAEAGAHLIGLMFYPASPRYVTLEQAAAIAAALPPYVPAVGVFVNPAAAFVSEAIAKCGLGMLQFHGDETSEFCTRFGLMSMKAIRVQNEDSLKQMAGFATDAFLLDACSGRGRGGTGESFDWNLAVKARAYGKPVFLAGGLTPGNVGEAVRTVQPFAVDVSSGVESAPGRKDPAKMRAFVEAVKSAQGGQP